MMGNIAEETRDRLKRVLIQDKLSSPLRVSEILREEIHHILSSYMELAEGVKFAINLDANGNYDISFLAKARKIYKIK